MTKVKKRASNHVGNHMVAPSDVDMGNIVKMLREHGNRIRKQKKNDDKPLVEAHRGRLKATAMWNGSRAILKITKPIRYGGWGRKA